MPGLSHNPSHSSATEPPYRQIERDLRAKIRSGHWVAGAQLPTRRDLAKEYGVAVRTVERAVADLLTAGLLRADGRSGTYVSDAPRLQTPGRMGEPGGDARTRGLVTTATLGIIDTPSLITHYPRTDEYGWNDTIATHVEQRFAGAGGSTLYFERFQDDTRGVPVREAVRALADDGADALVIIGVFDIPAWTSEVVAALSDQPLPAVYISPEAGPGDLAPSLPRVFFDNAAAGAQAAQHLIRAGYRPQAFFCPLVADWASRRLVGARQVAEAAGEDFRVWPGERLTGDHRIDPQVVSQTVRTYFAGADRRSRPGLIAANDSVAFTVLEEAVAQGWRPGLDFGLVSFDDHPRARGVGLTTLRPPLEALGDEAARQVLTMLHGDLTNYETRLRSHLLPRASTRGGLL